MRPLANYVAVALAIALATCVTWASETASAEEIDLALVLAVDVSGSMSDRELNAQRAGYVSAFRHPALAWSIESGENGRIAVAYLEWAGIYEQNVLVPWTVIDDASDAKGFANMLAAAPTYSGRGTSISLGLLAAWHLFDEPHISGTRRVIDVSGDGPNNAGPTVSAVRDELIAQGVTINGLALTFTAKRIVDSSDRIGANYVEAYYRECVAGGVGAFVVAVDSIESFAAAIQKKLLLEIANGSSTFIQIASSPMPGTLAKCSNSTQAPEQERLRRARP